MAIEILEYYRGLEELRPMISEGKHYEKLDPGAFYLGMNADVEGDGLDPVDLEGPTTKVMTFDSPKTPGIEREMYVDEYQAIRMEVT